jgi:hypothetical protein
MRRRDLGEELVDRGLWRTSSQVPGLSQELLQVLLHQRRVGRGLPQRHPHHRVGGAVTPKVAVAKAGHLQQPGAEDLPLLPSQFVQFPRLRLPRGDADLHGLVLSPELRAACVRPAVEDELGEGRGQRLCQVKPTEQLLGPLPEPDVEGVL